jgi:uncharacterized repeat protein (TIGR01451 family)
VQYWHFTYPQCENNPDGSPDYPPCAHSPAWGDSVKPEDDLWLEFDIWATAAGGYSAGTTRRMTMRNEISAMANKIEPNGNPGGQWFNDTAPVQVGSVITTVGIHYNFGNVNQGFDNDGDFAPDYNAWAQPIGDPGFDPSCFRLIRTTGLLTVSRSSGNPDLIIPFKDQLYFTNLPPDNTNVLGNVYYTFLALDGPCQTGVSPYQEVASGYDNEKFNGDYGTSLPRVASDPPDVTLDKSGNVTVTPGSRITYTVAYSNAGEEPAGLPLYGMPLVLSDTIPASTTLTGDIEASGFIVLYSTDNGQTYTTTQPTAIADVTNIQLWYTDTLAVHSGGAVTFSVQVDGNPFGAFVENCVDAQFDGAGSFVTDCHRTLISGTNSIGDFVWRDEDADGLQDAGEDGIDDITVYLYWDDDSDGELDSDDPLVATTTTAISGTTHGYYLFENLPDGNYLVTVKSDDPYIPYGYNYTTPELFAVDLDAAHATATGVSYLDADFGFGPVLRLDKSLVSDVTVYEGDLVTYNISLLNTRPGSEQGLCQYTLWATDVPTDGSPPAPATGNQAWDNRHEGIGVPNSTYAVADMENNSQNYGLTGYNIGVQAGNILTVEYRLYLKEIVEFITGKNNEDKLVVSLWLSDTEQAPLTFEYTGADFSEPAGGTYVFSQVLTRAWAWSDFRDNQVELGVEADQGSTSPYGDIGVDAAALIITTDQPCGGPNDTIAVLPVTDTYDADKLRFVSAMPPEDSLYTTNTPYLNTGVISWTNLGPLDAGQIKQLTLLFEALEPPNGVSTTLTNTVGVSGALYANGRPVHQASDWVTNTVLGTGSIGDTVWNDSDQDGVEDDGEPGIGFVVVELWLDDGDATFERGSGSNDDSLILTTTTTITGFYLFDGLQDGDYFVYVDPSTLPIGFSQTGDPDVAGPCDGSCDNTGGTNGPIPINNSDGITTNDDNLDQDFGYYGPALIDGTIWHDRNRSGTGSPEAGEEWLTGVVVTLTNGSLLTTTTDANGYFRFEGLSAGTYTVTVGPSSGDMSSGTWTQSFDTDGLTTTHQVTVTVETGGYARADYSYYQTGDTAVGDTVYYDWDADATQDGNEEGIPDITVYLYEDSDGDGVVDVGIDALMSSTVTADGSGAYPSGYYTFTHLPAHNYVVVVDRSDSDFPRGCSQTQDPDEDPGICTTCDSSGSADTTSGSVDDVDFGYRPTGSGAIGDTVWRDMDGDGLQSGVRETGIPSITVWLEVDLDSDGDYTRVATKTTDARGTYLFQSLPDADYRVVVDDNDPDLPQGAFRYSYIPSTSTAVTTTIIGGNTFLDADFGFMPLGAIGDTIYWDANRDAEQDWNEGGINNVVITLTNSSVITEGGTRWEIGTYELTKTTNATGTYLFTGLVSGTYTVIVGAMDGNPTLIGDPDTNGIPCPDLAAGDYLKPFCDGETTRDIAPGTIFLGADFGYDPTGVIGDYVWRDLDRDGYQDAGEPGIAGVVVTVSNGTTHTTTTDLDGYYSFDNLEDGDYTVWLDIPAGLAPTITDTDHIAANAGSTGIPSGTNQVSATVTLTDGEIQSINGAECLGCSLNVDFGFVLDGSLTLTGTVFFDGSGSAETNDIFTEAEDNPYGNITVYLYDETGTLLGTTKTAASGRYTFTNLSANSVYTVSVDANSLQLQGTELTAAGSYEVETYHTVSMGEADVGDVDFGFYQAIDFGDLPESYGTTVSAEGPGHISGTLYLGTALDTEGDGQPSTDASEDDDTNSDEDGVQPKNSTWNPGSTQTLSVTVTGDNGYLVYYIDFNADGDFADSGESIVYGAIGAGTSTIDIKIPSDFNPDNDLYARFRLYDSTQMTSYAPTGLTTNGEVEDYAWPVDGNPTAVTLAGFAAEPREGAVLVTWETVGEIDNLGFNLYRSRTSDGPYAQLNETLVAARGATFGATYTWLDQLVEPGVTYYYRLEDVETSGRTASHGPVHVTTAAAHHKYRIYVPLVCRSP